MEKLIIPITKSKGKVYSRGTKGARYIVGDLGSLNITLRPVKRLWDIAKTYAKDEVVLVEIRNDFDHYLTPAQVKRLAYFVKHREVLTASITRGGYLLIAAKRLSKTYPVGSHMYGRRGGCIQTAIGRHYDQELGEIYGGIKDDIDIGTTTKI